MLLLAFSAAMVGLIHSLAPGHWLPVVLITKTRRWSWKKGVLGALTTASGHIVLSLALGIAAILIGHTIFEQYEEDIERWGGLLVGMFGLGYALLAYFTHSHCHGHEHHGPSPREKTDPFIFLFLSGFSPCVAALPLFVAASQFGSVGIALSMAAFALGVAGALVTATVLVSLGIMKLDHPILEHHGDVITGVGVALMGLILFMGWIPHGHTH